MRIQHNIAAMNSYRNFSANTSSLNKNLEKLSTGYKINRAGDDAAGLAISEKMRAQITGLEGATKNSKDGISLIQTAEGALTEVHDMLNRMTTLAEQSANGTYQNELDREQLQKEVDALKSEIDRIADSTNFNGLKLLDGSLSDKFETTVVKDSAVTNITSTDFQKAGTSSTFQADESSVITRPSALGAQQPAEFIVDLNGITWSGAEATDKFKLSIDGVNIEHALAAASDGIAEVVTALKTQYTGADAAHSVVIDGHSWKIDAAAGKGGANTALKFTQVDTMAAGSAELNPSYKVSFDMEEVTTSGSTTLVKGTQQPNERTQVTKTGRPTGSTQQAQVDVKVDMANLKDGDKLIAGDKTYIFAVGSNSEYTASAYTAAGKSLATNEVRIDLTDIFKETSDKSDATLQKRALDEITRKMGDPTTNAANEATASDGSASTLWTVGNGEVNGGVGTLHFQSVVGTDETTLHLGGVAENGTLDLTTQAGVMNSFASQQSEAAATTSFDVDVTKINIGDTFTIDGTTFEFTNSDSASGSGNVAINLKDQGIDNGIIKSNTGSVMNAIKTKIENTMQVSKPNGTKQARFSASYEDGTMTLTSVDDASTSEYENRVAAKITTPTETTYGEGLVLQIGDTADSFNKLTVSIEDMHTSSLGIGDLDISTQEGAAAALDKIKTAINSVSDTRGNMGALQNRLDHTINNLGVMRENIQNAESNIRDTDVAEEMMEYTKNNILNQSAQAMLAQANQLPQGVLQLLG